MSDPINPHYYLRSGVESQQLAEANHPEQPEDDTVSEDSINLSGISWNSTSTFEVENPVNYLLLDTDPVEMANRLDMPKFDGSPGKKAEDWLTQFNNYGDLLNLDDERKGKMIQFFLCDHALAFYHSLDEQTKTDYENICNELAIRFDGMDGPFALLDLQQRHAENSTSYFTRILSATNQRGYPEPLLVSIALKGLKPELRQIVMPQDLQTIEDLRKAAHLAERTVASTSSVNVTAAFTDIVTAQIQGLADKIASMETSHSYQPPQPSSWAPRPRQQQFPPRYQGRQQQPAPMSRPAPSPLRQNGPAHGCQRCGEGRKHSFNDCKAKHVTCNYCFMVGHLYQCCFKRREDEAYGRR